MHARLPDRAPRERAAGLWDGHPDHRAVLALVRASRGVRQGPRRPHLDAWRNDWRRVGKEDRTGIWHETFLVRAGGNETVYGNMPSKGLGKGAELVPFAEWSTARSRIKSTLAAGS
jgi:hypothetical protein